MWDPLAQHWHWGRAAEETDSSHKKRRGKKTTSEFLTALELIWGRRFGGFTGTLGISRSDLNPEVLP